MSVFLCICKNFYCVHLSHPFPLVPCLKYFLANSNMSYLLSCRVLSSRSPSAKPSRETLWKSETDSEKQCDTHFDRQIKTFCVCTECLYTSIVWSISCAAMVDATATAMADDTANCPAPPRGSVFRSSGSDRKSGGAIGWTHSDGNAPERLNTAPNFQPNTHTWTVGIIKAHTPGSFVTLNNPQLF